MARHYTYPSAHIERMTLRMDGFVSVNAGYPGGELVTKPVIFSGNRMYLNYATSGAGSIRIEFQNEKGQALPGFSLEESPVLYGDEIDGEVVWRVLTRGRTACRYGGLRARRSRFDS